MGKHIGILGLLASETGNTLVKVSMEILTRKTRKKSVRPLRKFSAERLAEIKGAGIASQQFVEAIDGLVSFDKSNLQSRLMFKMINVIKSDKQSIRGKRSIADSDIELLKDFQLNHESPLHRMFSGSYKCYSNSYAGKVSIEIESFVVEKSVYQPPNVTHFRLEFAAVLMDFETGDATVVNRYDAAIDFETLHVPAVKMDLSFEKRNKLPIILLFGIQYMKEKNGELFPAAISKHNALAIVEVIPGFKSDK